MFKSIGFQLESEEKQLFIERKLSKNLHRKFQKNLIAIQQVVPSLLDYALNSPTQEYSIFVNKDEHINITSLFTGQVLYQSNPAEEIKQEVQEFIKNAPFVSLDRQVFEKYDQPLPVKVDALIIFGLGLGYHIIELLQNCRIKTLVIYEPIVDFLTCSLHATDWQLLFDLAKIQNTQISFQIGSSATSIVEDLQELKSVIPDCNKIYIYRHLCHPVTDDVFSFLISSNAFPEQLHKKGRQFLGYTQDDDFIEPRPLNALGIEKSIIPFQSKALFDKNLKALKRFYPDLYQVFKAYQPKAWLLQRDINNNLNLWHKERRVFFYQDWETDSQLLVDNYLQEPFKDDVIVGLEKSPKFTDFIHYKYIEKLQDVFQSFKVEKHRLPDKIESLIVFGVGLGKHIELLLEQRHIKSLYILEPNLDFFYASLFVTDWSQLLTNAELAGGRIYFNIGGDGSEYFNDLMGQFYLVGAFEIANTYLLPSYYTPQLAKSINNLRKQLKVVLAIGEHYDHARFGIAHTYLSLISNSRYLKNEDLVPALKKSIADIPVFIVGNGPSLDTLTDYIKQYRDGVIVVSCGTALGSLYKIGIQPDFHAEVEQNRAPYDWITQIKDTDYLKGIKLLSVNGIHPDTVSLFSNAYLVFKEGESSTHIFKEGLEKTGSAFSSLSFAYPTVSNLVLNYVVKMGFKSIYLMGVDLGFHDVNKHHSALSAYYNDGKEVYDYKFYHGSGFPVKGNFRSIVYTKPEFDVSRQLLERVIKSAESKIEVYNCSDGAYIDGTRPLEPQYILLNLESREAVSKRLNFYLENAYYPSVFVEDTDKILSGFDYVLLKETIANWLELIDVEIKNLNDAKSCINAQWEFLKQAVAKPENLVFHLFYGSATYFLSVMTKSLPAEDIESNFKLFNIVLSHWRDYLVDASEDFLTAPIRADFAKSGVF